MNNHFFPNLILPSFIAVFCILITSPTSYCNDNEQYAACSRGYSCGSSLQNIGYPFWGTNRAMYCGLKDYQLNCRENRYTILESGLKFRVLNISSSDRLMTIAREDLWNNTCLGITDETSLDDTPFLNYGPDVRNVTIYYDCTDLDALQHRINSFTCTSNRREVAGFYTSVKEDEFEFQLPNLTDTCYYGVNVSVQFTDNLRTGDLRQALQQGYDVQYHADNLCSGCHSSGGICGSGNSTRENFVCFCRDETHAVTCPPGSPPSPSPSPSPSAPPGNGSNSRPRPNIVTGNGSNLRWKLVIGIVAVVIGIIACVIFFIFRSKILSILSTMCCRKITKIDQDLEAFIRNHGPLALKRYSFSDVKKMTNSFKDKLGQGGYGGVYKGKLSDGRLVAVKLLNTSKGNGEEFINEVASISRTSHVNVVSLLGFCLESNKRVLIYEFMPNGSLEKFINNGDTLKANQHLGWEKLYQIAIGIGRGLEYLHRGCNMRIFHFDIKPHNILLDEDFCPKIADFGLAKLCPPKQSIVSMHEARGTIGYIAPEVFNRNFGNVSHKSDVYSYGMMILEMVGCRDNPNAGVCNSSDLYFPQWIYKHFEEGKEFEMLGPLTSEENEIVKKLIIVGLWCIQTRPTDRPSINLVLDMLQGSTDALEIPPIPLLSSPSRPPIHISSTTTTTLS